MSENTYFGSMPYATFGPWAFPISERGLTSTIRHMVHEFPGIDGGTPEKNGLAVKRVRIAPVFDTEIKTYTAPNQGRPLYPYVLDRLQEMHENKTTALLNVPGVRPMQAFITTLTRGFRANVLSGEDVVLDFLQDDPLAGGGKAFRSSAKASIGVSARNVADEFAAYLAAHPEGVRQADVDLFAKLADSANAVFSVVDTVEDNINQIAAKVDGLTQLAQRAESKARMLTDPMAWRVVESVKDLWSIAESLKETVDARQQAKEYRTPTGQTLTLQEVSMAIYKRTDRGMDLLRYNSIEDSLAIPPGTRILYYED